MTGRSVIALVSAPGGFAGRTDVFEAATADWYHVGPVNEALERLLGVPTHVSRLISAEEMPWARPGGPADLLAWAGSQVVRTGPAVQVRTWNLSTVFRLPTATGPAGLKAVPPFFADEAAVIGVVAAYDPGPVPEVIAAAPHRVLLGDESGGNCRNVEPDDISEVVPRSPARRGCVRPRCRRRRSDCRTR